MHGLVQTNKMAAHFVGHVAASVLPFTEAAFPLTIPARAKGSLSCPAA
jgi:hypothetical protein